MTILIMVIVKKVISNIVVSFTHICNKSFSSGVFPCKMKVAKVIALYKAGEKKMLLLIIYLFLYFRNFLKY